MELVGREAGGVCVSLPWRDWGAPAGGSLRNNYHLKKLDLPLKRGTLYASLVAFATAVSFGCKGAPPFGFIGRGTWILCGGCFVVMIFFLKRVDTIVIFLSEKRGLVYRSGDGSGLQTHDHRDAAKLMILCPESSRLGVCRGDPLFAFIVAVCRGDAEAELLFSVCSFADFLAYTRADWHGR